MAAQTSAFIMWQWNCRGFLHKRAPLQQFIRSHSEKPHVIILQETLTDNVTLPCYRSVVKNKEGRGVGALISNKLTHVVHDLNMASSKIEHVMIEIIPGPTNRESIFFLNVYSSPKDLRQHFKALLSKAVQLSIGSPLIIAGDFNAPHHTWGYSYDTRKGEDLWRETMNQDLMLVTDPAFPTRCGTSSSRDTAPDLAFVRNVAEAKWTKLNVDFGSDHYHLATVLRVARTR